MYEKFEPSILHQIKSNYYIFARWAEKIISLCNDRKRGSICEPIRRRPTIHREPMVYRAHSG